MNNKYFLLLIILMSLGLAKASADTNFRDTTKETKFKGAIVFDKAAGGFHIYKITGVATREVVQLTKEWDEDSEEPKWSPDGVYIAYVKKIRQPEASNVYIMNSDGTHDRKITNFDHGIVFNLRWNGEGKEIYFSYNPNRVGEGIDKRVVNIKTGAIRKISAVNEKIDNCVNVILSPNQKTLLCIQYLTPNKGVISIYQIEKNSNKIKRLITRIKNILYSSKQFLTTLILSGNQYKKEKELNFNNSINLIWAEDGSKFAIINGITGSDLYVFDKTGNEITKISGLCKNEGAACLKQWPFNSTKLLYDCYCGAEGIAERIYMLDIKSKESLFITEGYNPDWYFDLKEK